MPDVLEACKNILVGCMGLSPDETVLVVTDTDKEDIGRAIAQAASGLGADAVMMTMRPRRVNGEEPPPSVAVAMAASGVVLCPTSKSLTHTQARAVAARAGARIATMPGITADMLYAGAMTADYTAVSQLTLRVKEILDKARCARIEYRGRVLTLGLEGRTAVASTGRFLKPGESGNLPSGEAYIAPVEGTAEGILYVDGSVAGLGRVKAPIEVVVSGGRAQKFRDLEWDRTCPAEGEEGGSRSGATDAPHPFLGESGSAGELGRLLNTPEARNVAELGIGTNDRARLTGVILEDEKIHGTVHVAFGDNSTFGGKVKAGIHVDFIMLKPDLYLDDDPIIKAGRFVI